MNLKKLAIVAALSAASVSAFAIDFDQTSVADTTTVIAVGGGEMGTSALALVGNVAFIAQDTGSNFAYVEQTGGNNFAAIAQAVNDSNLGTIYQTGDANKAMIVQH